MDGLEQAVQDNDQNAEEEEINTFPGPGQIKCNDQFGIYVVASRTIEQGEQILEENPLMISPRLDWNYDPLNWKGEKICLGCYKRCPWTSVCLLCKWPVCEKICEKAFMHSQFECELFARYQIKPRNLNFDYPALETIRCLMLRERDPKKWKKFLRHEAHVSQRRSDAKTRECREYVINFIQNECHLKAVYDCDLIERVMGIISINSFCMMNDYHRHASLIFHAPSYIAHSCDPNMDVIWMFYPRFGSTYDQQYFAVKFFASRRIEAGELLTFSYISSLSWRPVIDRQVYLATYWYFYCECSKCRADFLQELLNTDEWDVDSTISISESGRDHESEPHEKDFATDCDAGVVQEDDDEIEFGWIGDTIGPIKRQKEPAVAVTFTVKLGWVAADTANVISLPEPIGEEEFAWIGNNISEINCQTCQEEMDTDFGWIDGIIGPISPQYKNDTDFGCSECEYTVNPVEKSEAETDTIVTINVGWTIDTDTDFGWIGDMIGPIPRLGSA